MQQGSTIALCTDTHFWHGGNNFQSSDGRIQLQSATELIQSTLIDEICKSDPDIVIHLGDWVCGGGSFNMSKTQFCQSLQQMQSAFATLPAPVYALPGNHDCPAGEDYSYFAQLWNSQPGLGYTIDLPEARLILLNTQGHSQAQLGAAYPGDPISGWASEAELKRLEDSLASAGNRPILLFVHQLLYPWIGSQPWKDLYQVENRQNVLELMARYGNVRAVFQGHAHMLDIQTTEIGENPCTFIVTPAIIEYPMAWLQLQLTAHKLSVSIQRLPLPELAATSRQSGNGQGWREGLSDWHDFCIEL